MICHDKYCVPIGERLSRQLARSRVEAKLSSVEIPILPRSQRVHREEGVRVFVLELGRRGHFAKNFDSNLIVGAEVAREK